MLKAERMRAGLRQDEMAKLLHMTTQNYRNYEAGSYAKMSEELEQKCSKIFKCEFKYRRGEENE